MTNYRDLKPLGSVARVRSGFAFKSEDMGETGIPIIKIKNISPPVVNIADCERIPKNVISITPNSDRYSIQTGDILIAMTGATVGKIGRFPPTRERFYLNQRVGKVYLTQPDLADYRYIYYVLSQEMYVQEMFGTADGSAQANISGTQIERLEIPLPPLTEQRFIARILGTLDDKIELNGRMNETLEAMVRALFKSWFVDFDPARDSTPRNPFNHIFADHFNASPLGKIPSGWSATNWGKLVRLEYGKSLSGYARHDKNYPVYGTNGKIGSHSEPLCPHPGIIIGRKGAYRGIHFCDVPFFVIDTAFYVEPQEQVELRWAYYELLRQDINNMDSGSAIPSTSRDDFYSLSVIAPPIAVQRKFVQLLEPNWARQTANDREIATLAALRDLLLPKLISGELRVEDAERTVAEAAV